MKKLIIGEKPNLAKAVCKALKISNGANNQYIVTSAFGHLLQLADIEDYTGKEKWNDVPLPFFPDEMVFQIPKIKKNDSPKLKERKTGIKKQYELIESYIKSNDVTEIINFGDADREGQIIIDNIIQKIFKDNRISKPVYRLWIKDVTDENIKKGLVSLKNNSEFQNLQNEGLARTYIDWLYGINFTRFVTNKANAQKVFNCGRVIIPTVKVIYDRDIEIKKFVSKKYYQVESKCTVDDIDLTLTSNVKHDENSSANADEEALSLNTQKAIVTSLENKEVKKQPPKLFSLSKLQGLLSSKHKMSFEKSDKLIQQLYEKGFLSYPRTNTEYLSENEKDDVQKAIDCLDNSDLLEMKDTKRIFDITKIESHSAIIVTGQKPDLSTLSEEEQIVYTVVLNRFISNFLIEPCTINQTKVTLSVGDTQFNFTGESIKQEGFLKYEPLNLKSILPNFTMNQEFDVNFKKIEKKTSPPSKYTETSLSEYLKSPYKHNIAEDENSDDAEYYIELLKGIEIGTEATRTGILTNAIKTGYLTLNGQTLDIAPKGIELIDLLNKLKINLYKDKTIEVSILLKEVSDNKKNIQEVLEYAQAEILDIISSSKDIDISDLSIQSDEQEIIGICPRCKKNIYESKINFYCGSGKDGCGFSMWKNDKFWIGKGKKLTKSLVKQLLKGATEVKGMKPKDITKSPYTAKIELVDTGKYINYKMSFD